MKNLFKNTIIVIIITLLAALLIWLMTAFITWTFDLSTLDVPARIGVCFVWVLLIISSVAVYFIFND